MRTMDEKHAEVAYNPLLHAVIITWKDFASFDDYRKTVEAAYIVAKEHSCANWISDMTKGKAVTVTASKWLKDTFIPEKAKEGVIRKVAFLLDFNPFRRLFVESIKESMQMSGLEFKCFSSKAEMESWIKGTMKPTHALEGTGFNHFY